MTTKAEGNIFSPSGLQTSGNRKSPLWLQPVAHIWVDIDLISLRSSLEEVAQCPVCLELVKPPVTLCVNGHGMCTACKATLTKCPTCRLPFCTTEPRILNEILQKIPKVCKYYYEGCINLASDDHEVYCQFRRVKCIFPHKDDHSVFCDWEGLACKWSSHVYVDCPGLEPCWIDIDERDKFKIRHFKDVVSYKSIYCYDDDTIGEFIFYYSKLNGNFCMYIKQLPFVKPTEVTYFTLSIGNRIHDEVMYKYKIRATTMITLERDVNVEENVYCMRVPVEELEKLVDEDGNLHVNYKIKTEPL